MAPIPPVKVGEVIKLGVVGFGKKGNPFFKHKDYIIFLEEYKGVQISLNQMISIKITKVFDKYSFAQIVEEK